MFEFILGVIVGTVFSDFWRFLFVQARRKVRQYMAKNTEAH